MNIEDIEFLINNSTGIIKFMFILIKNKKLLEINTDNLVERKDNSSTKIKTKRKVNNHKKYRMYEYIYSIFFKTNV